MPGYKGRLDPGGVQGQWLVREWGEKCSCVRNWWPLLALNKVKRGQKKKTEPCIYVKFQIYFDKVTKLSSIYPSRLMLLKLLADIATLYLGPLCFYSFKFVKTEISGSDFLKNRTHRSSLTSCIQVCGSRQTASTMNKSRKPLSP